jgi:hypothetical protein
MVGSSHRGTAASDGKMHASLRASYGMTVRRMKTYTGGQGFVYQYYFVGKRTVVSGVEQGAETEFIFDVTSDRKTTFAVSVRLQQSAAGEWERVHGRALTDAEQYGAVKMRLFRAFDEVEDMMLNGRILLIGPGDLELLLQSLGVS